MATQSLLWTALPNGVDTENRAKVSVMVSPRLDAQNEPQRLDTFTDFLDWPQTVRGSQFTLRYGSDEVTISGSQLNGRSHIDSTLAIADSQVWAAMLPPEAFVNGFSFNDMRSSTVLSYSASEIAQQQKALYTALAKRDDDLPEILSLQQDSDWQHFIAQVNRLDREFSVRKSGLRDIASQFEQLKSEVKFSGLPAAVRALAEFQLFHTPPSSPAVQDYSNFNAGIEKQNTRWRAFERTPLPTRAELASKYDFHQIVAAMNQYPTLLRLMGLVVDFVVEPGVFAPASNKLLSVQVKLPEAVNSVVTRLPETSAKVRCQLDKNGFFARSSPNNTHKVKIKQGLLDINLEHFDLLQVDVDGAGIKAMNTARSLARQNTPARRLDSTTREERRSGVPSLRNAGLTLIQRKRENDLRQRFDNSFNLNADIEAQFQSANPSATINTALYAEDLVRGYRYDIWDDISRRWHSLYRRNASYSIEGLPAVQIADEEGTSRLAATRSADPSSNQDVLYLHEAVVAWTGWSLAAPAPGNIVGVDDQHGKQETEVPTGIPLRSEFQAFPNSLPRLRYGRRYWIRARAVDLAGNSLPPSPVDYGSEKPESQAQSYLRFDPIRPPVVALCRNAINQIEAPGEGESMLRMAIRTFNSTPELNQIDTTEIVHRAVLAERVSVKEAELHGVLDQAGQVDPGFFPMLATKDIDLETAAIPSIPLPLAEPGAPVGSTDYAVYDLGSALSYLPDPLCVELSARLFDHPNISSQRIIPIPLYSVDSAWPDAMPFRVRLLEASGTQPEYVEAEHTLYVPLPKACRARLRLSVKPDSRTLALMGIWGWLSAADRALLEPRALNGQHWMLTPWREIELVHAVQKPLIDPDVVVRVVRKKNKTWAIPTITAPVSLKSTEKVDLLADWHEPGIDDAQAPIDNPRTDHAFSVKISEPGKYRGIPEHLVMKPDLIRAGSVGADAVADKVHEFHDTRYRRVVYWLEATSRFREYMPAEVLTELDTNNKKQLTDKNIKISGLSEVNWIPNAAPPPAPKVLYVVPTYQWLRSSTDNDIRSWRRSGGFRIYLDGPWYASGYGEMLAVVLPGDAMADLDPNVLPGSQPLKNIVTQWGNDPIWVSPFRNGPSPQLKDFPLARTERDLSGAWLPDYVPADEADQPPQPFPVKNLTHPQMSDGGNPGSKDTSRKLVNIAPHDVDYDAERGLWFCDIDVSSSASYYPFVRLALARYQPVSVPDCHLSNIVLADFMTLPNDRYVSVSHDENPLKHSIQISGSSYSDSSGHQESQFAPVEIHRLPDGSFTTTQAADVSATTVVEVWVEKLDPSLGEDFGWQKDDEAIISENSRQRGPLSTPATAEKIDVPVISERLSSINDETERSMLQFRERTALKQLGEKNYKGLLAKGLVELVLQAPTLWQGSATLPAASANDGVRRRLAIAEYEEYFVDDRSPYDAISTTKGRRVVYIDHIELLPQP